MSFKVESKEHLFFLSRKMISNKNLDGFEFKNKNIDEKLKELAGEYYTLTTDNEHEIFFKNLRPPSSIMTWQIKESKASNFGELVNELEVLLKQFKDVIHGRYPARKYPHLLIDQNFTDFLGNNDYLIGKKEVTKKFSETMNSIRMNPGVYFLYNSKKKLVYIGKSRDLGSRIPLSIGERNAYYYDFILTKTASDCGIYEMYFISKYKPKLNKEGKYPDETTVELPTLEFNGIKKIFK